MKLLQDLMQLHEAASFKEDPIPSYAVCYSRDGVVFKDDVFTGTREQCISYMEKHKAPKGSMFDLMDIESGKLVSFKRRVSSRCESIAEAGRTFTLHNPNIKPRGAPEEKARAFDKVHPRTGARPDRSYLKGYHGGAAEGKGKYVALEYADEGDFISVIVVRDDIEMTYHQPKKDPNDEYNGINVLFFPDGKIDGDTYDVQSKRQWLKDKEKIVAVAKAALKDEDLPGQYDGLMGREVKRGKGKLSFDTDNHVIRKKPLDRHRSDEGLEEAKKQTPFGVKLGGISSEKPSFGFADRLNAQKVESELKDADIKYTRRSNFGVFYFDFSDEATMKKAARLAKKVIDKSVESEW